MAAAFSLIGFLSSALYYRKFHPSGKPLPDWSAKAKLF